MWRIPGVLYPRGNLYTAEYFSPESKLQRYTVSAREDRKGKEGKTLTLTLLFAVATSAAVGSKESPAYTLSDFVLKTNATPIRWPRVTRNLAGMTLSSILMSESGLCRYWSCQVSSLCRNLPRSQVRGAIFREQKKRRSRCTVPVVDIFRIFEATGQTMCMYYSRKPETGRETRLLWTSVFPSVASLSGPRSMSFVMQEISALFTRKGSFHRISKTGECTETAASAQAKDIGRRRRRANSLQHCGSDPPVSKQHYFIPQIRKKSAKNTVYIFVIFIHRRSLCNTRRCGLWYVRGFLYVEVQGKPSFHSGNSSVSRVLRALRSERG